MPPAAKNLFEKRFLDFQKLLISLTLGQILQRWIRGTNVCLTKVFWGSRGQFFKNAPWSSKTKKKEVSNAFSKS